MKLILVNGKKRSGKDHFAAMLQDQLDVEGYTSEIMSFADPIKDIIATTFSISQEQLDKFKNDEEPVLLRDNGYQTIVSNMRLVLQNFGTEAMKNWFGEEVWVTLLLERTRDLEVDFVIVPDFRFEIEAIDTGVTVKIRNDEIEKNCTDEHRSENELNDYPFDYIIDNTGYRDITDDVENLVNELTKEL